MFEKEQTGELNKNLSFPRSAISISVNKQPETKNEKKK
jgi:hypothetical protein